MNNMGLDHGRMRKEPDNQSSGKATAARLLLLHLQSDGATKTPVIMTLTQHFIFPILCRTGSRPDSPMSMQPLPWSTGTVGHSAVARHDALLPRHF